MQRFNYVRAANIHEAISALSADSAAQIIAGGTNLVDLMKYNVERPSLVVDINGLPLRDIETAADGAMRIGALVTNSEVAYDDRVARAFPLLCSAILAGASPQLRNAATTGGNLLQRARCYYFYDPSTPCNKRNPGSGCSAIGGVNRIHAVLGASDSCIATHPSDMCVGLAALEAEIEISGLGGTRRLPISEFHRLPGNQPELDNVLSHDELVTAVVLRQNTFGNHHTYLKLRDRLSYAFALVSVAVGLEVKDGVIQTARVALGGVAHKPWRSADAERLLEGKALDEADFGSFADRLLQGAVGQGHNDFKIPLARKAIVRALRQAAAGTPQVQSNKSPR